MDTAKEQLTREQLRRVADYLYDGEPLVAHYMSLLRQFKDGDRILLWCVREKRRGKRFVEFFKNEADEPESMGVLRGVETARRFIYGNKEKLRGTDLV